MMPLSQYLRKRRYESKNYSEGLAHALSHDEGVALSNNSEKSVVVIIKPSATASLHISAMSRRECTHTG